jgi:hypothetical protein
MAKRKRKVLLLGAKGYQQTGEGVQVDCCLWHEIKKIPNIRDYDTIIVDLLDLKTDKDREKIDWDLFHNLLNFPNIIDILSNNGVIIIVGDARFRIPIPKSIESDKKKDETDQPFLEWSGIIFSWDSEPGDTVHFINDYEHSRFERYVSNLKTWTYSLEKCIVNKDVLCQKFNLDYMEKNNFEIDIDRDFFCFNRYQNALGFSIRYKYQKHERYSKPEVFSTDGPIIFLPTVTLSPDETRQLILSDICGVEATLPEPEWINEFIAPGQKKIDEEINTIEGDIQNILERLESAKARRAKTRECLKLLYEREFALEPVVREILRGLGAHVEDPSEANKEDGWILIRVGDKTYEGVIEVKSTRSDQFSEDGRKQLLDWIDRGRTMRQKNYKGLFIGNSAVDKNFKERPWAFSDSWTKAAELSGICALKTEDLYVIHLLNARGSIEIDDFWRDLFETNGIFDMKQYWEMLAPKDDNTS